MIKIERIHCINLALDSLGLTLASFASIASFGVIPKPSDRPDRERIDQLIRIFEIITTRSNSKVGNDNQNRNFIFSRILMQLTELLNNLSSNSLQSQFIPLLSKASILIRPVGAKLVDKSFRRTVRTVVSSARNRLASR